MRFDKDRDILTIDVRELCRRAYPPADIDNRRHATEAEGDPSPLISQRAGEGALKCHPLTLDSQHMGINIRLRGQISIIHPEVSDGECIHPAEAEEIVFVPPQMLGGVPSEEHASRARLYALMYAEAWQLQKIGCRLTYASPDGAKTRSFFKIYDIDDLRFYLAVAVDRVSDQLLDERDREVVRRASAAQAKFPYTSLRGGQEELIRSVYSSIKNSRRLFVQAPTGIGKTISTIYGAVKALGGGHIGRILYLTAKASTRREAFRAAAALSNAGLMLRTITLFSREQTCINPTAAGSGSCGLYCNPDACPFARDYYTKRDAAIRSLLSRYRGFTRTLIISSASAASVCPYELSLDLAELCDMVICDYNYVFDPTVRSHRMIERDAGDDTAILVDEAHNLPERARDIFSFEFSTSMLDSFACYLPALGERVQKSSDKLYKYLGELRGLCSDNLYRSEDGTETGYYVGSDIPRGAEKYISALGDACDAYLRTGTAGITPESSPAVSACAQMARICRKWRGSTDAEGDGYRTYIDISRGRTLLRRYCLDPARPINEAMQGIRAAVFFSATLMPPDYFTEILGGGNNSSNIALQSPFPPQNLFLGVVSSMSTRFEDRERSVGRMSSIIAATASARAGNYIVYFPSYRFLDDVHARFTKKYPSVSVIKQTPKMSPAERDAFIAFFGDDKKLRVGFCVLGGSFSEGVDLPGDRLIGVIIAGVGLPGLSFERNLIRDYYQGKVEDGYNYAYTYPGMNRVLQAAGRVIRRRDDRGVVILADDRYTSPPYAPSPRYAESPAAHGLFPPHWQDIRTISDISSLPGMLKDFWKNTAAADDDTEQPPRK